MTTKSTQSSIGIVGGGPAGMAAAFALSKAGQHVEVYEASDSVGGLAKTIELWGQKVDLGPHRFFSSDARVNRFWLEAVEGQYKMVDRLTRIYYKKRFFDYPLKAQNALYNLGVFEAARCVLSYGKQRISPMTEAEGSFEQWVTQRFGKRLFEIFFKTYSEKLWGISCKVLDADFAAQRIKKLSLFEAVKNAFIPDKNNKHRTLVDRFAYPVDGTGMVYENMARKVGELGGKIHINTPVRRVHASPTSGQPAVELMDGTVHQHRHVISSMPLTLLVQQLPDVPEEVVSATQQLKFRNTILVFLLVDGKDLFPDNWLYVHSNALKTGRITNFRNWVPELYGESEQTILALEYWCYDDDPDWKASSQELIQLAKDEITSTGLTKTCRIVDGHVQKISRCYPVYDRGYRAHLSIVQDYLNEISTLTPIGRYGSFKYNNQDHSILMGMLAARNLGETESHDLWSVNTDYDSYQEEAFISETGLSSTTDAEA